MCRNLEGMYQTLEANLQLRSYSQDEFIASIETRIIDLANQSPEKINSSATLNSIIQMVVDLDAYQAEKARQAPASSTSGSANANIAPDQSWRGLKGLVAPGLKDQGETEPQSLETCTLSGSLEIVSLLDNPEYIALSYVWGDPSRLSKILVNELEVHITENLAIALEHLQPSDDALTLWVDAVSICSKASKIIKNI
jgi:Heterokaryon incompatibility protein (HET)